MPVTSVTNTTTNTPSSSGTSALLDSEAFLNMFIVQLQNQDPLEPMSNAEMMQQLTQLQNIETTMAMKSIVENLLAREESINPLSHYLDMMGKTAKVDAGKGKFEEGTIVSIGQDGDDVVFEMVVKDSKGDETIKSYKIKQLVGLTVY